MSAVIPLHPCLGMGSWTIVTIRQVIDLVADVRGTWPDRFAEVCELVEGATGGVTSQSAEFVSIASGTCSHFGGPSCGREW